MVIHDVIKIRYTRQGYLPDFPYHLISDAEMFDAFMREDGFFFANYPEPLGFEEQYQRLVDAIKYHIEQYNAGQESSSVESLYTLPEWIYSYMIGETVGPGSPEQDRHDLFVLLDLDNMEDEFNSQIYAKIFRTSDRWTYKLSSEDRQHRPPTMFGEPHVIKSLRLANT